jgi:hypothetical protein
MEYDIEDLMSAAIAQRPMDFESAFKSIINDRITDAIDDKKLELSKTVFNEPEDEEEIEDDEDEIEEETEKLDELSTPTLKRYAEKANKSADQLDTNIERHSGKKVYRKTGAQDQDERDLGNRETGIGRASAKIWQRNQKKNK